MTASYQTRLRTPTGGLIAVITDFLQLGYTRKRNSPGAAAFVLSGAHRAALSVERDCIVEFWRRDPEAGLPWYSDFTALVAGTDWERTDRETLAITCLGPLDLLDRRIIAYPAGTTGRSEFAGAPAETVLKELVRHNATALATVANGREEDGRFTNVTITVEPDQGRGIVKPLGCSHKNLLDTLQAHAAACGDDFDLVQVGDAAFEFRYYHGQRGQDKTGSVVVAIERGNAKRVRYRESWAGQATAAIVAGQGQGAAREILVVHSADHTPGNHREIFVDANDVTLGDTAALQARGQERLLENAGVHELEFEVIPNQSTVYGRDWDLGDLVTGLYRNVEAVLWVDEVTVVVDSQGERIGMGPA
ncbi:MAG TPA: hypothetical protein PKD55_05805 [Bellilinea sp.]|nr:hypothetical protein [Bellilinea sp.]